MYTALRKSLNKENDKGFTLIELLVVIIIIGILAAIAIPIFLSQRKKGFEASQKSDARSIATQLETYYTDSQLYPTSVTQSGQVLTFVTAATGDVEETVTLSPNNDAYIMGTGSDNAGFCVGVTNSNNPGKTVFYDSAAGGIQASTVTACPSVYDTAILAANTTTTTTTTT